MNYKFISWNIDSLNAALTGTSERAALSLAVVKNLAQAQPDVLAIQETKLPSTGPKKKLIWKFWKICLKVIKSSGVHQ